MNKKKILFRADGNESIGLGHLYRLFALVEIYKKYFDIVFITKGASTSSIIPERYHSVYIPDHVEVQQEPLWFLENFSPSEYIIIIDGYNFKSIYQKELKKNGYFLVFIDDLIKGEQWADIVVNHSPNIIESQYLKQKHTHFALGTDYSILRPSFLKAAKIERKIERIHSAFICFGGADKLDLTLKAARALTRISLIENIHIVLGGAYLHNEIDGLEKEESKIKVHRNLNEEAMCHLMMQCQIAIAPASTILYELCAVKMPILSGYYATNQQNIYTALSERGAVAKGGDFTRYTSSDFREKIIHILKNSNHSNFLKEQQKLFDGNSDIRFIKLLNDVYTSVRKAKKEDMERVLDWSNDELVRQNSYNSEFINLKDHKNWFYSKIEEPNYLILIALYDEKEAGIVKYQIKKEYSVIGISISREFRGKKLAPSFLDKSAREYFKVQDVPILAYIKEENIASIKSFENAGYALYEKRIIDGINSLVYKLEKNDI